MLIYLSGMQLSLEEAEEVLSFKNVTLEVKSLSVFMPDCLISYLHRVMFDLSSMHAFNTEHIITVVGLAPVLLISEPKLWDFFF
jgi:hypothetical protein